MESSWSMRRGEAESWKHRVCLMHQQQSGWFYPWGVFGLSISCKCNLRITKCMYIYGRWLVVGIQLWDVALIYVVENFP
jgi:hypothetical protein